MFGGRGRGRRGGRGRDADSDAEEDEEQQQKQESMFLTLPPGKLERRKFRWAVGYTVTKIICDCCACLT
jgi:hypothetical protein